MKKDSGISRPQQIFLMLAVFLFFSADGFGQHWVGEHAKAVITPYLMQQTINYLASDALQGRGTPGPGLDSAGNYIARQFELSGIKPLKGNYFQDIQFCYYDLGNDLFLSMVKDLQTINFELKKDFIPYDFSGSLPAEGAMVFAGYGITAPEYNYDDYKDIDVEHKIVVILRQEPGQTDSAQTKFKGVELSHYSWLEEKQKTARDHGAAGILVISGPLNFASQQPSGYPWPTLSDTLPKFPLPMRYCGSQTENIPMVSVGESIIRELFGSVDTLKRLQQHIDHDMQPHSFEIAGKTLVMNINLTDRPIGGRNVIGFIEGADPILKNEAVVVGGHYDHLGLRKERKPGADSVYNGADDNASGTSGMLAVARSFASMPAPPKRSIIFMAFAGEEMGLLGSETYVRNPLWPLGKTVAMFNLDMISRNSPDSLEIIGARQNPGLVKIIRKQNKETGFILAESKDKEMDEGSDHYSFFEKGVPAVFFFAGLHKDYHKVTDEADKIDAGKAARVARLAFLTAWTAANEGRIYKIAK